MSSRLDPFIYLPLFLEALKHEIGILVRIDDPSVQKRFVAQLHECRKLAGRAEFDELIVMTPQPPGTIYIARKGTELD